MNSIDKIISLAFGKIISQKFCVHDYEFVIGKGFLNLGCYGVPYHKCKKCGKVKDD